MMDQTIRVEQIGLVLATEQGMFSATVVVDQELFQTVIAVKAEEAGDKPGIWLSKILEEALTGKRSTIVDYSKPRYEYRMVRDSYLTTNHLARIVNNAAQDGFRVVQVEHYAPRSVLILLEKDAG